MLLVSVPIFFRIHCNRQKRSCSRCSLWCYQEQETPQLAKNSWAYLTNLPDTMRRSETFCKCKRGFVSIQVDLSTSQHCFVRRSYFFFLGACWKTCRWCKKSINYASHSWRSGSSTDTRRVSVLWEIMLKVKKKH